MKVINLFAGPGSGKSTTAAGIFHAMKMKHISVELVTEYAKDLVYANQIDFLQSNQEFVFAEQNRRQHALTDKVDYAISDSPLLLSHIYARQGNNRFSNERLEAFLDYVTVVFRSYDTINFFLKRPEPETFLQTGRIHDYNESLSIDDKLLAVLNTLKIQYHVVPVDEGTLDKILAHIMQHK